MVGECLSGARKQQAAGDLAGSLSRIEEALAAYPRELRLMQIQETVQRELLSQQRQARRRDLEELRRMEREVKTMTDPAVKQVFGERVQGIAGKYLEDGEILAVANGLLGRLNMATMQGRDAGGEKSKIPGTAASPSSPGATASIFPPTTMDVPPSPASEKISAPVSPRPNLTEDPALPVASAPSPVEPKLSSHSISRYRQCQLHPKILLNFRGA